MRTISVTAARRLAISAQQLAGDSLPATRAGILETVTRLGRLQLDPTRTVERTHQLVLWSRLGPFDRDDLRRLLEEDRSLFEYSAFIIPTDDFPLFRARMRAFPAGDSKRARDYREWMRANDALRRSILAQLALGAARAEDSPQGAGAGSHRAGGVRRRRQDRLHARGEHEHLEPVVDPLRS